MDNKDNERLERGRLKYLEYIKKAKEKRAKGTYKTKIIISGSFIEEYIYQNEITLGKKAVRRKKRKNKPREEQTEMRSGVLRRTRMTIMRLVNSNPDFITFLTLTFDENKFENKKDITEFEKCNYLFMTFIQRLKYNFIGIKYLAVPEFQGDYYFRTNIKKEFGGAIHYHLLLNQMVDTKKIEKVWRHGFVKINKIKSINNVGLYVSKYLSKESFNRKYFGKKKFFYSRNLNRPQEFKGQECEEMLMGYSPPPEKVYEKEFSNKYRGEVTVNIYQIK
ncbi:MAG: hypothetical protein PHR98_01980 [Candidatus Shapirobacteria bacterium]|nr:hypothetical protein [Candidatus Shapirobacteria bacterium]